MARSAGQAPGAVACRQGDRLGLAVDPEPNAAGNSASAASSRQPVPVPRSRMRRRGPRRGRESGERGVDQRLLSARGIRVAGETSRSSVRNPWRPRVKASGSRAARRARRASEGAPDRRRLLPEPACLAARDVDAGAPARWRRETSRTLPGEVAARILLPLGGGRGGARRAGITPPRPGARPGPRRSARR